MGLATTKVSLIDSNPYLIVKATFYFLPNKFWGNYAAGSHIMAMSSLWVVTPDTDLQRDKLLD